MTIEQVKTNNDWFVYLKELETTIARVENDVSVVNRRLNIFDLRLTKALKTVEKLLGRSELFD